MSFGEHPNAQSISKRASYESDTIQDRRGDLSKVSFDEQPRAQSTRRKTSYDTCTWRNQKPIQAPTKFNGKSSWETFHAQFDIAASINGWCEGDKAAFLATSLEGKAALVLNNMSNDDRRYYRLLVAALATRFGEIHLSELARAKLKILMKVKNESIQELVESVESLRLRLDCKTCLREITSLMLSTEDNLRLRFRQARPQSLQTSLETALELEPFQLASRH